MRNPGRITRGIIIELAGREGLSVKEGAFTRADLYSAEEVFVTNTTMEVMPVSKVDSQKYTVGKIAKLLRTFYRQEVNAYVSHIKAEGPSLWGQGD